MVYQRIYHSVDTATVKFNDRILFVADVPSGQVTERLTLTLKTCTSLESFTGPTLRSEGEGNNENILKFYKMVASAFVIRSEG